MIILVKTFLSGFRILFRNNANQELEIWIKLQQLHVLSPLVKTNGD